MCRADPHLILRCDLPWGVGGRFGFPVFSRSALSWLQRTFLLLGPPLIAIILNIFF